MVEDSYISRLGSRLSRLSEETDKYNFECPFCLEGSKAGRTKRGFIYKKDNYKYYCFNCAKSIKFTGFLYELDRQLYYQYMEESKEERFYDTVSSFDRKKIVKEVRHIDSSEFSPLLESFQQFFYAITDSSAAVEYLKQRRVSEQLFPLLKFYFNDREEVSFNRSIVFPFWTSDERIYGFQSRLLYDKRFHIELRDKTYPKIWNLFRVDLDKPVFIFEGFFDSIVVDNSIALNGADISAEYLRQIKKPVFVFDHDKTGREKAAKYCKLGYDVFVYPENFKYKDFNEYYVTENMKRVQVEAFIKKNVFDPDTAQLLMLSRTIR